MADWKVTIEEHGPRVWKRVFRIVGCEADASDCFQEVFLKAVMMARHKDIENMGGFLNLLATRCAIDCLRRRHSRFAFSSDAFESQPADRRCGDPADRLQNGELIGAVRAGLSQLPALEAEAFALQAFEELSYRQIADTMNIRENHVGVLINRARGKLREILKSTAVAYEREIPDAK